MRAVLLLLVLACRILAECPAAPLSAEEAQARLAQAEQAAREAFRQRRFAHAAGSLRQALCFAPRNPRLYHQLGLAEAAAGEFVRADAALAQAQKMAPRDFGILLSHAQVELSLEKPDLARQTLRAAERVQPDGPAAAQAVARLEALLGRAYVARKQTDLAIAAFLRAKQAGQRDVETLLLLATLENTQGAYADAILDARQVQEGGAEVPAAQRSAAAAIAGLAHKNQKQYGEAIALLRQAIDLAPSPTGYLALAEIYEVQNQPAEAVKVLEQARAALPDSVAVTIALGRDLTSTGDARRASAILQEATKKAPDNPEGWRWLAEAQNALGQMAAATASLKQIARCAPGYPMIQVMIAQALLKEDPVDYADALRTLELAERTSAADPDLYYMRGKIYATQGRYQEAAAALERAVELGPTLATSYYQLGLVYQKLGRQNEAAQQFARFAFFKADR